MQLNYHKMELMWCATVRRQHRQHGPTIGTLTVTSLSSVRDLGVYVDSELSMQSHVRRTVSRCFVVLRQLRSIRPQIPTTVFQSVNCRAGSIAVGLLHQCLTRTSCLLHQVPPVRSESCWLVFRIGGSAHITDALISLHWLRVPERISYKLAVIRTEPSTALSLDICSRV